MNTAMGDNENEEDSDAMSALKEKGGRKSSLVIIRQPYTYLEPFIRSMFEGAEDIRIIADRRFHDRRKVATPGEYSQRRTTNDRRLSVPMLDILIDVKP